MISSGGLRSGLRVILFVLKNAKAEDNISPVDRIEKRDLNADAMTQAIMNWSSIVFEISSKPAFEKHTEERSPPMRKLALISFSLRYSVSQSLHSNLVLRSS